MCYNCTKFTGIDFVTIQNMKTCMEILRVGPRPTEALALRKLQNMVIQNSLLHPGMLQNIIRQNVLDFSIIELPSHSILLKDIFRNLKNVSQMIARYAWLSFEFLDSTFLFAFYRPLGLLRTSCVCICRLASFCYWFRHS